MLMYIDKQIQKFIKEDCDIIQQNFAKKYNLPIKLINTNCELSNIDEDYYDVTAIFNIDGTDVDLTWAYIIENNDIFMDVSRDDLVRALKSQYDEIILNGYSEIESSNETKINAATQEIEVENVDDENDMSEDSTQNLDERGEFRTPRDAQTETSFEDDKPDSDDVDVEEVDEEVEEVEPEIDDINIETDNNIANHYIAECDYCHGIFISPVILSDADVKSIYGICPICEHESDQFLKWIIKDVKDI